MFPHRNLVPMRESDSEEERNSQIKFSEKTKKLLRSVAPTREEKALRSMPRGHITADQCRKKINFDESFTFSSPNIGRQKSQMTEYEGHLEKLKRQKELVELELASARKANENLEQQVSEFRQETFSLRQQLSDAKIDYRNSSLMDESLMTRIEAEQVTDTARKYITWFNTAMEQLRHAEKILRKEKLWNEENKQELLAAERVYPIEKDASDIAVLAAGSIQDFPGLTSLREPIEEENDQPEETVASHAGVNLSPIRKEHYLLDLSITEPYQLESNDGYQKIQDHVRHLEQQNTLLAEKLKIASIRSNKALELEEEKRSLESENKILDHKLHCAMGELASLRRVKVEQVSGKMPDAITYELSAAQIELDKNKLRVVELENQLMELQEKNRDVNLKIEEKTETINELEKRIIELETMQRNKDEELEHLQMKTHGMASFSSFQESSSESRSASTLAPREILEPSTVPAYQTTDAGDTTTILHMTDNPLSQAHVRLIEQESAIRKRKVSGSDDSDVKRQKLDEEVAYLHQQLSKLEGKNLTLQNIQEDTLKKLRRFRELTTFLTGCQVKMSKESDDIVKVSSIYDESNKEFTFKVGSENADLLDMGDQMPSQSTVSWDDAARYYIGERSSVPAFLAKVTLTLEEQRELDVVERTHMFSVLHE